MDYIYAHFEVETDAEDDGTIRGYGSVFGNIDSYGGTVAKGAFKKTIADAKAGNAPWPVMLSLHNSHTPIGIWIGMDEDNHGLRLQGKLAINTRRGADAYALLKMKPHTMTIKELAWMQFIELRQLTDHVPRQLTPRMPTVRLCLLTNDHRVDRHSVRRYSSIREKTDVRHDNRLTVDDFFCQNNRMVNARVRRCHFIGSTAY
jgi:hypothetical protein